MSQQDSNTTETQAEYRRKLSPLLEYVYAVAQEAMMKWNSEEGNKDERPSSL